MKSNYVQGEKESAISKIFAIFFFSLNKETIYVLQTFFSPIEKKRDKYRKYLRKAFSPKKV